MRATALDWRVADVTGETKRGHRIERRVVMLFCKRCGAEWVCQTWPLGGLSVQVYELGCLMPCGDAVRDDPRCRSARLPTEREQDQQQQDTSHADTKPLLLDAQAAGRTLHKHELLPTLRFDGSIRRPGAPRSLVVARSARRRAPGVVLCRRIFHLLSQNHDRHGDGFHRLQHNGWYVRIIAARFHIVHADSQHGRHVRCASGALALRALVGLAAVVRRQSTIRSALRLAGSAGGTSCCTSPAVACVVSTLRQACAEEIGGQLAVWWPDSTYPTH